MTITTKISQVWFGEQERAISTPLLGLAPTLGGKSSSVILKLRERTRYVKIALSVTIKCSFGN